MDEEMLCFLREDSDEEDDYDELFLDSISIDYSGSDTNESLLENFTSRPALPDVPEESESSGEEDSTSLPDDCEECLRSERGHQHQHQSGVEVLEDSLDSLREEIIALINGKSGRRLSGVPEKAECVDQSEDKSTSEKQTCRGTLLQSQTCETRTNSADFQDAATKGDCFESSNGLSAAKNTRRCSENHEHHRTANYSLPKQADFGSASNSAGKKVVLKPTLCAVCHERCDFRDTLSFENVSLKLHKRCSKCTDCEKQLDSAMMVKFLNEQPYCRTCFNRLNQKPSTPTECSPDPGPGARTCLSNSHKSEVCTACNKNVYANESVSVSNTHQSYKYHEVCLRCERCSRRLCTSESSFYRGSVFCCHCMKENMRIERAQLSATKHDAASKLGS